RLQLRVALGQGLLVLGSQLGARRAQSQVQGLQLTATLVRLDQHRDRAAQDLGHDGYCDVVDRAELVALEAIELADMYSGDEDDGSALHPRMLANQARHLETVH